MANARVTQFVFEAVTLSEPAARVCQFVLELATIPIPPVISCGNPPDGRVDTPYTHTFPASGGLLPYVFSITTPALPTGLTLDSSTGVVSGTPSAAGNYPFVITVTDGNLNSSSVACAINIIGGRLKITFRGVKRVKRCAEPELVEVPGIPSVNRAV